ncbi:MAG: hypothetical protein K2P69_06050 [Eubacterium sp.]|nr:hypothetical protein [Eubacterium sp.]
MCEKIEVSTLPKTWILDLDGTLVKHNGYKIDGYDTLLPGARGLLNNIARQDMVIIVTARRKEYAGLTERFLKEQGICYQHIIYDAPYGERILINDCKPGGLKTAVAVNLKRDAATNVRIDINKDR